MKLSKVFVATTSTILFAGNLFAGTMGPIHEARNLYVRADVGYNFFNNPRAFTADASNNAATPAVQSTISNQWGYNVGLGYKFLPSVRGDVTFTYRPAAKFKITDNYPETGRSSFNNFTVMANGYFDIEAFNLPVTPYLMAGFGVSSNATKKIYWPEVAQNEFGQSNQEVVWQVGAGLSYPVLENLLLDVNYQYVDLGKVSNSGHYDSTGVNTAASLVGYPTTFKTLFSNQVQVGVRYYI